MAPVIVTFLSDFGLEDWFVGVVHGVILTRCAEARVVDLTHAIAPGDVAHGAFVLEAAAPDFPPGTVHLAVVDPGVGTRRLPLAVRARGQWFVGPDNGLLEWALLDPGAEARALADARHFRAPVSRTFHGRDVFAPVAAALAGGARFEELGPVVRAPVRLERPRPSLREGRLVGTVLFVDRFGNAITNLTGEDIAAAFPGAGDDALEVEIFGRTVRGVSRAYGDSPVGTLVAILGSSGRLELAEVNGHAASRWGIGPRDHVVVRRSA
uniref:SAM-dependent chlorinase/fluorinase n=1 Tax=Eiseniibacteriota bacterium TaxID=2212470 RepID=A0A832MKH4_UNCEI